MEAHFQPPERRVGLGQLRLAPERPALLVFMFYALFEDAAAMSRHEVDPQQRITTRIFVQFIARFLAHSWQPVAVQLVIAGSAWPTCVRRAVQRARLRHIGPADAECWGMLTGGELAQLFQPAVCLPYPSYADNSPSSGCAAQVADLPVVAADVGGVRSLVENEVTGLLCTLAPASIAHQALRLLRDAGPPPPRPRRACSAHAPATKPCYALPRAPWQPGSRTAPASEGARPGRLAGVTVPLSRRGAASVTLRMGVKGILTGNKAREATGAGKQAAIE